MFTYVEICGVLDEVSAAVPFDRRGRVSNHTTVEPRHFTFCSFDVLEQLSELGWHDVSGYRCRSSVAQLAQCYKSRHNSGTSQLLFIICFLNF